ncbi:TerD family protein [Streptomyces sp. NPDC060194]|uniref:TerD family protein n=1 Tax=Streptomyces sp. NPDC060194 TaxID=3347069 RepID=UPI003659B638
MSTRGKDFAKEFGKVEARLRWDPSPLGAPAHDLDLVAAVYRADSPHERPVYLVHFGERSPDGTISLDRDSTTGQGLGYDEVMSLEPGRMSADHGRIVIGVVVQQRAGRLTFGEVAGTGVQLREGHTELFSDDLSGVPEATAATVAEFVRVGGGSWTLRKDVRGFDTDPRTFATVMGAPGA